MANSKELAAIRLRECRAEKQETLEDLARLAGVNRTTVMRWENGRTTRIQSATLERLAAHFCVNPAWLAGDPHAQQKDPEQWLRQNRQSVGRMTEIPVLGVVRAGRGGVVFEERIGVETVDSNDIEPDEEYFYLRVTGDSMAPVICEGDYVLVRRQSNVDSGSYGVAIVDGEEGVVKRIIAIEDGIELQSVNPYYPPRRFTGKDVSRVQIIGLVRESKRKF